MTSNSLVEKVATDLIVALAQHFDRTGCPAMAVTHASEEGVSLSLHFSMDRAKAFAAMEDGWRDRAQEMLDRLPKVEDRTLYAMGQAYALQSLLLDLSPPPPEVER